MSVVTEAEAAIQQTTGAVEPNRPPVVSVSWDAMEACLTLQPLSGSYTLEEVRAVITKAGVVEGVDWQLVEDLVTAGTPCQSVVIASGQQAVQPVDATIEYLTDLQSGSLEEHRGRVDWRELNTVHSVEAGTPLLRKQPGQPGTYGKNVRGKIIPCRSPHDVHLKLGKGVGPSADDENLIVAQVQGAIRVDSSGKLSVESVYTVSSDVDLSVGHIDHIGSILISGSVKPGFRVKATADIEVRGLIEGATIIAGGTIVAAGIVGPGAVVEAGGDVRARFANNSTVKAGGDLSLSQEAVNSVLEAEGAVSVGGPRPTAGAVRGGSVVAGKEIVVFNVGGFAGGKTRLRSGQDYFTPRRACRLEGESSDLKARLDRVEAGIDRLSSDDGALVSNKDEMLAQLRSAQQELVAQLTAIGAQRHTIEQTAQHASSISVFGTAHAGTDVVVDGRERRLTDDYERQRFVKESGAVIAVALK